MISEFSSVSKSGCSMKVSPGSLRVGIGVFSRSCSTKLLYSLSTKRRDASSYWMICRLPFICVDHKMRSCIFSRSTACALVVVFCPRTPLESLVVMNDFPTPGSPITDTFKSASLFFSKYGLTEAAKALRRSGRLFTGINALSFISP